MQAAIKQITSKHWYLFLQHLDSVVTLSGFGLFAFNFDKELFVFLGQPSYLGRYRISSQFFRVKER